MESRLSEEEHDRAFAAGVASVLGEKRAGFLSGLASIGKGLVALPKDLMMYGALAGTATGIGAQMLKDQITKESPDEALNRNLEAIYVAKRKEKEDEQWMNKVRAMRADLMVNRKKMSVEEYTAKYNALVDALNEKKA